MAAANNNAPGMLERDVNNMAALLWSLCARTALGTSYGQGIWKLYESGNLTPDVKLTGHFKSSNNRLMWVVS